ncbi:hypothetical protein ACN26Y_06545 [Micromonospora sp. WMMD558]|uniref:hypothetical protein n=1 Tax=Micromonospora sp. WMMD558 TaxID=3403462 RepID=UPI003BF5C7AA
MDRFIEPLAWLAGFFAFFRLNRWLVDRKGLDPRPYFAPSWWGPIGSLIILLAEPRGWRRRA